MGVGYGRFLEFTTLRGRSSTHRSKVVMKSLCFSIGREEHGSPLCDGGAGKDYCYGAALCCQQPALQKFLLTIDAKGSWVCLLYQRPSGTSGRVSLPARSLRRKPKGSRHFPRVTLILAEPGTTRPSCRRARHAPPHPPRPALLGCHKNAYAEVCTSPAC